MVIDEHDCGEPVGAGPDSRPGASQALLFVRNFIKHPATVGWLLPSSRFVVDEVLKQVDWGKAKVIVEYGPGVGAFTRELLQRMALDATLIAIELNPEFCAYLRTSLRDSRLLLVNESAAEIDRVLPRFGFAHADYVISGIPFAPIPHDARDDIVRKTHSALGPDGSFLVYQFSSVVLPYLRRVFSRVSRDFELLNVLPTQLFYCVR